NKYMENNKRLEIQSKRYNKRTYTETTNRPTGSSNKLERNNQTQETTEQKEIKRKLEEFPNIKSKNNEKNNEKYKKQKNQIENSKDHILIIAIDYTLQIDTSIYKFIFNLLKIDISEAVVVETY
ncbi:3296_t:CDS:2, partial [Dentiscutata erythropus]